MSSSEKLGFASAPQRPFLVTILAVGVLILSIVFLAGSLRALHMSRYPDLYISNVFLTYMISRGIFFAALGFISAWGLLRGSRWAPIVTLAAVGLFILFYWIEWFFLIDPGNRASNYPFMILLSVIVLLFSFFILFRSNNRDYFGA